MKINKIDLKKLGKRFSQSAIFIFSSSYESRCRSLANSISPSIVQRAYILEAIDLLPYVQTSARYLLRRFPKRSSLVKVSTSDPILSADNLFQVITELAASSDLPELIIDITTFTHETLLVLVRLLRLLLSSAQSKRVTFAYTGAEEYSLGDDVEHKWLSKGVKSIRTVLGYPGTSLPSRKTHLIVIVGYEHERAAKLIAMLEPNSISLGFGRSSNATTDKNKDANEHYHRLVQRVASGYAEVHSFEIFCNDPVQTANAIVTESRRFRGRNIILAPMNNKLSTLGSALAVFDSDAFQVCYTSVLEYNYEHYSAPGKTCYLIKLPELFG